MRWLLIFCLALAVGCGPKTEVVNGGYKIARDPDWYPLQVGGQALGLTAFSDDLLGAIAQEEGFEYVVFATSYALMQSQLQRGVIDAILTTLPPIPEFRELYDFSDVYFYVGPVLVVRAGSSIDSMKGMEGKTAGIQVASNAMLLVAKIPNVVIREFMGSAAALQALDKGEVDGVVMDALPAYAYVHDLYSVSLKVVTPPLTNDGLRLVTLKGKNDELREMFNKGLHEVVENETYEKLEKKWGLILDEAAYPKKPLAHLADYLTTLSTAPFATSLP